MLPAVAPDADLPGALPDLNNAAHDQPVGFLTTSQVQQLRDSTLFGIVKISDSFTSSTTLSPKIFTGCLVVLMTATTFTTQRQLMRKNMPESALTGQYAQQQKLLLYVLPVVFAVGGIAFPIGVLLYWTTSNLWTMGQQFYVIRNNPTPGTPAFLAKQQREKEKAKDRPSAGGSSATPPPPVLPPPVQRVQPKKQSRQQPQEAAHQGSAAAGPGLVEAEQHRPNPGWRWHVLGRGGRAAAQEVAEEMTAPSVLAIHPSRSEP